MRFAITAVTAALAMATSVFAQTADFDPIDKPEANQVIPAGSSYTVTWEAPAKYAATTIKISLIGGADQGHQIPLMDIASGVKNSAESYTWNVASSLGDKAVYGLVFTSEQDSTIFQYSKPFHIKAAAGSSASASVTGSATTVITKSAGVKTVTLQTTTTTPNTTTTSTMAMTSTSSCANSTTWKPTYSKTIVTTTALVAPTTTTPAAVPTHTKEAAAPRAAASSLALIGALLMAYLAL